MLRGPWHWHKNQAAKIRGKKKQKTRGNTDAPETWNTYQIQNHHRILLSKSCIDSHGSLDWQLLRHHRCQNQYTPHVVQAVGHSWELEMSPQVASTFPCSSENVWMQVPIIILRMWRLDYFREEIKQQGRFLVTVPGTALQISRCLEPPLTQHVSGKNFTRSSWGVLSPFSKPTLRT